MMKATIIGITQSRSYGSVNYLVYSVKQLRNWK